MLLLGFIYIAIIYFSLQNYFFLAILNFLLQFFIFVYRKHIYFYQYFNFRLQNFIFVLQYFNSLANIYGIVLTPAASKNFFGSVFARRHLTKLISDRLLRQRNGLMIYNKIERVLVITKRILNYYNTNFSLGITSKVQKVNQKYTFTQKLTTKHNFQTPSLTFSSTVTEWNAQDCGISKTAKDTSMLPSKINQMKVGLSHEAGRALMPSCLGISPPKSRIFQFSDAAIVYISSNGRPQLLAQGCVYANRAESVTNEQNDLPSVM